MRPRILFAIAALIALLLLFATRGFESSSSPHAAATTPARHAPLRVISYNVQLLPLEVLNKYPDSEYRAAQQAKVLATYDIVGLNEVFQPARRAQLIESLREAWGDQFHCVIPPAGQRSRFGLDSGLILASRRPIVDSAAITFDNDSLIFEKGVFGDGVARKGVLWALVQHQLADGNVMLIDCYVTHLESRDAPRRTEQYTKLAAFIHKHSRHNRPTILMGDLNTVGNARELDDESSAYHQLIRDLTSLGRTWLDLGMLMDRATWGTSDPASPTGGDRIDYIFLSNANSPRPVNARQARVLRLADPHTGYLSDHSAIEAVFEESL